MLHCRGQAEAQTKSMGLGSGQDLKREDTDALPSGGVVKREDADGLPSGGIVRREDVGALPSGGVAKREDVDGLPSGGIVKREDVGALPSGGVAKCEDVGALPSEAQGCSVNYKGEPFKMIHCDFKLEALQFDPLHALPSTDSAGGQGGDAPSSGDGAQGEDADME
jgi:hypothetical protein